MSSQRERNVGQVIISEQHPTLRNLYLDLVNSNNDGAIPTSTPTDLKSLVAALGRPTRLLIGDLGGPSSPILKMMKEGTVPQVRSINISYAEEDAEAIKTEYTNVIATFSKPIPDIGILDDLIQKELHGR